MDSELGAHTGTVAESQDGQAGVGVRFEGVRVPLMRLGSGGRRNERCLDALVGWHSLHLLGWL